MSAGRNILGRILIYAILIGSTCRIIAEDSETAKLKAEQLVKAAQNYLSSADIRFQKAQALMSESREYRKLEYSTEKERTSHMKTAGRKEFEAGHLYTVARGGLEGDGGYDKAAQVLSRASGEYKKAGNAEQADELARLAESTMATATRACELSAEAYEAAAEAFSSVDLNQMAAANEKAAKMREILSARLN